MSEKVNMGGRVEVRVEVPEWMRSEEIAKQVHERVKTIMRGVEFHGASEGTIGAVATLVVEGYVAGYGDGRGILECGPEDEADIENIASIIIDSQTGAPGRGAPDLLALAAFVRRVASRIETRGIALTGTASQGMVS